MIRKVVVITIALLACIEAAGRLWLPGPLRTDPLSNFIPNVKNYGAIQKLLATPREKKGRRVVITGGSVAYGWGATSDDKRVTSQLQSLLRERPKTRSLDIIGAGVPDFDALDEFVLYAHFLRKFDPDAVVMLTGFNDVWNALRDQLVSGQDPRLLAAMRHRVLLPTETGRLFGAFLKSFALNVDAVLKKVSCVYRFAAERAALMRYTPIKNLASVDERKNADSLVTFLDAIEAFNHVLKKDHKRLIVVIQPMRSLTRLPQNEYPISRYEMKMRAVYTDFLKPKMNSLSKDSGIRIVDLNDTPLTDDLARSGSFIDFCHLNDDGNLALARSLAAIIENEVGLAP